MIEFIKPHVQREAPENLVFAEHSGETASLQGKWLYSDWRAVEVRNPTVWRNIVAWYLRACGVPTGRIALFLGLSESRALQVGLKARRIASKERATSPSIKRIQRKWHRARLKELDPAEQAALVLREREEEARNAEYFLANCVKADLFVVSQALKMGRDALDALRNLEQRGKATSLLRNKARLAQ